MTKVDELQRLRLMVTFENLFYTPIYVAVNGGFLYRQGLNVMFSTVPSGSTSIDILKEGRADIVQSGLSRSFMELDEGNEEAPLHIAEINQRDGFFLLSRWPTQEWTWKDIEGSSILPIGFTPVPWMSLKFALNREGVNLDQVSLIEGLSARDAVNAFRKGEADYLHMVNPIAQQLIEEGVGHMATAIGPTLGYICYSSLAAMPEFVQKSPEVIHRFVRGFYDALRWMTANDATAIAALVRPFFSEIPQSVLESSIRRYKEQRTWPDDPLIGEDGFLAIRNVLIAGGLVKGRHLYDRLVRPEFAQAATREYDPEESDLDVASDPD